MAYITDPSLFTDGDHDYYYGSYSLTPSTLTEIHDAISDADVTNNSLWQQFLDAFFTDVSAEQTFIQSDASNPSIVTALSEIVHTAGAWPPQPLTFFNDYEFIQGMFGHLLRDFFYNYAPAHYIPTQIDTAAEIRAKFSLYLADSQRDPSTLKQNTILLWLWELLTQMLSTINNSTLTQGGYLLAMTAAENQAATQLSLIEYTPQANDQDYSTQAANMNLQTRADVYRAQRSANGKQGQMAQSMITTLRDAATQQAQLMTTIMQTMETMFQAIMKK